MRHHYLLLIIVALGATSCRPASADNSAELSTGQSATTAMTDPLPTLSPSMVSLGEMVYAANCASCHGEELEGEADWKTQNEDKSFRSPPHDESGHTWHHDDPMLLDSIRLGGARFEGLDIGGSSNMPAFEAVLTEEEMNAVLDYIKNSWPEDVRVLQWQQTQRTIEFQQTVQESD